ncbi:MAG TPA: hypothetical protein VIT85_04705 [Solirubrobacterales bacterium]
MGATSQAWQVEYASGPDPATERWPAWPHSATCLETTFDPVATFSGPTEAENGTGAPEEALRAYLSEGLHASLPLKNWRGLSVTESEARFAAGRLGLGLITLRLISTDGRWAVSGSPSDCMAQTSSETADALRWRLQRPQRLHRKTRALRIDTTVEACRPPPAGDLGREFRSIGRDLVLTVWRERPTGPEPKCLRRTTYSLTVPLPGNLGKRRVWDGSTYPPRRIG